MDQVKIGKFIAERRKENNLTQMQLAEKLNITDRAISKWENGKAMPDSSIMLDLCKELKISVNELLSGEVIKMENYDVNVERNLMEMVKQKEASDKRLLKMEVAIGYISSVTFLVLIFVASFIEMQDWIRILLIVFGFVTFIIGLHNCVKIEQTAGYYECSKCHHKYVPTLSSVYMSRHIGRTRHMVCPACGQKSWQKKVISK